MTNDETMVRQHSGGGNGRPRRDFPWRPLLWSVPAILLILPAVAMQFSDEVDWNIFDFIFAALMFGTVGLIVELTVRANGSWAYRGGVMIAVAAAFLIVWINGAVGIIGSEDNPANLMFGAVLAVALLGSVIALFRASGMALAMYAAAAVEIGVGAIALAGRMGDGPAYPWDVIGSTVVLTGMWLVSGLLFRMAAVRRSA